MNKLGISLSTDDFGTGYSSLSYLHRFPFDRLKVDRSFVSKMDSDQKSEAIVRTILLLAQNLNIEVVAEGIETETQLRTLRQNGCRTGQGYFFSKPVTAETAAELLQNGLPNLAAALPYNFGEMENHQMLKLGQSSIKKAEVKSSAFLTVVSPVMFIFLQSAHISDRVCRCIRHAV